jgi:ubiquinone biosynthesis accessory factor UbiK
MLDPKTLQEMTKQFIDSLPPGLKAWHEAIANHFRQTIQSCFENMSLVTREEFEIQTQVLAKTRDKLEKLEAKLQTLENKLPENPVE